MKTKKLLILIYMSHRLYSKEFKRIEIINSITEKSTGWSIKMKSKDYVFRILDECDFIRTVLSAFSDINNCSNFDQINFSKIFAGRMMFNGKLKLKSFIEQCEMFPFSVNIIMENYWILLRPEQPISGHISFYERDKDEFINPNKEAKNKIGNFSITCYNPSVSDNEGNKFECSYNVEFQIIPTSDILQRVVQLEDELYDIKESLKTLHQDTWVSLDGNDL